MVLLSPIFNLPFITNSAGTPLNGGKIYQYVAGSSSVLQETFTDEGGLTGNPNPIVLNSAGQLPNAIWLSQGLAYNLVLTEADGTTVIKGFDDVIGVQAHTSSTAGTTTVWVDAPSATFLSPTQFLVPGNLTQEFAIGNRAKVTQTGGTQYGVISAVSFSSPNTTVTLINDGTVLNSSVSGAAYSVLTALGRTVDAGGVSYTGAFTYSAGSVGAKIQALEVVDATTNTRIDALRKVWLATYSAGAYAITPSPAITTYVTDMVFTVAFGNTNSGALTLNVNGVGAKSLKVYDYTGAKQNPSIIAGTVSVVAYDGVDFIILNQLPAAPLAAAPRGLVALTSNGTWTCPANVFWAKVTVVGGGGGAGNGGTFGMDAVIRQGGGGGGGAVAIKGVTVTPGTVYPVSIGGGGGTLTAGGTTTFGITTVVASGGLPGGNASGGGNGVGGAGGTTGTGDLIIAGSGALGALGGAASGYGGAGTLYGGGANATTSTGPSGLAGLCLIEY